ncbi:hypothetical protein [Haliangium sp.]|uniref:hypothetical protein n=1 Tax=Haliangium sp. TaxID=2663208 RepID=UPI003D112FDF
MAKMSTQVRNRSANAAYVVSAHAEHGASIITGLLAHNTYLPAEQQIDEATVERFLAWLASTLAHKSSAMVAAELAYVEEQADDPIVRSRRDEAARPLATCLSRVRSRVGAVLGNTGLPSYGLAEPPPRVPAALADYARVVVKLLGTNPRSQDDGIGGTFDTAILASAIEERLAPLRAALDELLEEQRQLEGAMITRDRVVGEWLDVYQGTAASFAQLCRMGGHHELGRRVRPTTRRTSGQEPPPADDTIGDVGGGGDGGNGDGGPDGPDGIDPRPDGSNVPAVAAR